MILFFTIIFVSVSVQNVYAANLIYSTSFENATVYDANRLNLEGLGPYRPTNWISNNSGGIWWIEDKNNPTPGAPTPRTGNKMIGLSVPASTAQGIRSELGLVDLGNSEGTNSITLRNEAFISVWLWLPPDWTLNNTGNNWYELVNPTYCINPAYYPKHCLHIMKPNGPNGPYDLDYHDSLGPNATGGEGWQHVITLSHLPNFVVPRGEWFNLKWWLKLHETDGAVKLWISSSYYGNDYLLTNYTGIQTRNAPTNQPGPPPYEYPYYWSSSVGKVYLDGDNIAKSLYVDDLEVWDGIPTQDGGTTTTTTIPPGQVTISGQLRNTTGIIQSNIIIYNQGTNQINTSQITSNGNYNLGIWPGIYDLQYNILHIPNFFIKIISINIISNLQNVINYVNRIGNSISFTADITGDKEIQVYSDSIPNRILKNGTVLQNVSSYPQLISNSWYYNSSENKIYMKVNSVVTTTTTTSSTSTSSTSTSTISSTTTTVQSAANLLFNTSFENAQISSCSGYEYGLNLGICNYGMIQYSLPPTGGLLWIEDGGQYSNSPTPHSGNRCLGLRSGPVTGTSHARAEWELTHLQGGTGWTCGFGDNYPALAVPDDYYVSVYLYLPSDWSRVPAGYGGSSQYDPPWYEMLNLYVLYDDAGNLYPRASVLILTKTDGSYWMTLEYDWTIGSADKIRWTLFDPLDIDTLRGKWVKWSWYVHRSTIPTEAMIKVWMNDNLLITATSNNSNFRTKGLSSVNWFFAFLKSYLQYNDGTYHYIWADDLEVWDGIPS